MVIGVELDQSKTPDEDAVLKVSAKRVAQLENILGEIKRTAKLGPGAAASLKGKLGFSLCACFGRFGRAKLRPLIRRAGENRTGMNVQIESAIDFWATFFRRYMPRPVPMFLVDLDTVVSYSDGEGSRAGVGIAVWSSRLPDGPLAAFLEVPEYIRILWDRGRTKDHSDIFLIEAVGPLAVLETYPKIVRNCLWVHYIDNVAAHVVHLPLLAAMW